MLQLCIDAKAHNLSIPMDYLEQIDIGVPISEQGGWTSAVLEFLPAIISRHNVPFSDLQISIRWPSKPTSRSGI